MSDRSIANPDNPIDREQPDEMVLTDERRTLPVDVRVFLFVTVFFAVVATVYGITAQEWAGTTLLALSFVFSGAITLYMFTRSRRHTTDTKPVAKELPGETVEEPYFPESSVWPFTVGLGLVVSLTGLVFGLWVLLPGVVLLIRGGVGWAAQSRKGT